VNNMVGKTPFCGTLEACEKTSPCLFLDVDHGTLSLNDVKPCPTIFTVTKWSDMQSIQPLIKDKKWDKLADYVKAEPKEYRSVVIDSGTELANSVLLRSIVAEDDRNEGIPDQPAYLKSQVRFSIMWRSFRDLPITCIMTAGVKDQRDDVSGIVKLFPEFSPALLHDLQRHSDLILFMNVLQEKDGEKSRWIRSLQTQPSSRFVARDRSGKLDPIIKGERLYWKTLLDKIFA
jgi:hypothetical protein